MNFVKWVSKLRKKLEIAREVVQENMKNKRAKYKFEVGALVLTRLPRPTGKLEIKILKEAGIVQKSRSPWSSLTVPIRKLDSFVRLCIDYRKVNALMEPDTYHMPRVHVMMELVGEAHFIMKIDLTKGFTTRFP